MKTTSVKRSEAGVVTAETALTIPTVVIVALLGAWMVSLGVVQARAEDAAAQAARVMARGEGSEAARRVALRSATKGSRVDVRVVDGTVTVTVRSPTRPPLALVDGPTLCATAVASMEAGS